MIKKIIIKELDKYPDRKDKQCIRQSFYKFLDFDEEEIDIAIKELIEEKKIIIKKDYSKKKNDIIILRGK